MDAGIFPDNHLLHVKILTISLFAKKSNTQIKKMPSLIEDKVIKS